MKNIEHHSSIKKMNNIFYYSHFFNSISFPFLGFRVENIPWHLLNIYKYNVIVFAIILIAIIPIILVSLENFNVNLLKYVVYFLASTFPLLYKGVDIYSIRVAAKKIFYFSCIIAVLQQLGLFYFFNDFIRSYFISRFDSPNFSAGRVQLLVTEPARAAHYILLTYLIAFWKRFEIRPLVYLLIISIFFIKSSSGLLILLLVIPIVVITKEKRLPIIIATTCLVLLFLLLQVYINENSKFSTISILLFKVLNGSEKDLDLLINYLLNRSGDRINNLFTTISSISFIPGFNSEIMNPVLMKTPVSFIAYHVKILGGLGLLIFFIYIYKKVGSRFLNFILSKGFLIFLIIGIFYSPPGSPLLLIFLMVLIYDEHKISVEKKLKKQNI